MFSIHAKDSSQKFLVATIILISMTEVLSSITVAFSLFFIEKDLCCSINIIVWIMNIYIISCSAIMPLTNSLVLIFGQRKLLIISLMGFAVFSTLCGLSTEYKTLLIARGFQGIFGGLLIPLSQSIIINSFSKEKLPTALSTWNFGIMLAPILGPGIGAVINHFHHWPWIFYINIPLSALGIIGTLLFIKRNKKIKRARNKKIIIRNFFRTFLILLFIQLILITSKNLEFIDLFSSLIILIIVCSIFYISKFKNFSLPKSGIFKYHYFKIGLLIYILYSATLLSTLSIYPTFLQTVVGFSSFSSSIILITRGISCLLMTVLMPFFIEKINIRHLLFLGLSLSILSTYMIKTSILEKEIYLFLLIEIIQGMGIAIFMISLSVKSFYSLENKNTLKATGLYNYVRNIGTSIGLFVISLNENYLYSNTQETKNTYLSTSLRFFIYRARNNISAFANFLQKMKLISEYNPGINPQNFTIIGKKSSETPVSKTWVFLPKLPRTFLKGLFPVLFYPSPLILEFLDNMTFSSNRVGGFQGNFIAVKGQIDPER